MFNDYEALEQIIGAKIISSEYKTTEERRSDIGLQLVKIWQQNKFLDTSPEAINRLQHFSRINNLKELQNIKSSNMDFYNTGYDNIPIEKDSVIYCDIPYRNTDCGLYKSDFDYERFYQWALSQDTIFISEYSMPNDFIEVANIDKIVLSTTADVRLRSIEKIFTTPKTLEHFEMPLRYEQISLFDWE